jgi:hypothetical protein
LQSGEIWKHKHSHSRIRRFGRIAIGFFGLGVRYFIWGGQALFDFPKATPEVNRTMGLWGFWMPGFMQFLAGIILIVGLTWFSVFGSAPPLYMAGLAFTAFGITGLQWLIAGTLVPALSRTVGWQLGFYSSAFLEHSFFLRPGTYLS